MAQHTKMTVGRAINESLSIVSKYPIIVLIFLIPAIVSLIGGMAISGSATSAFGSFDEGAIQDGNFDTFFPSIGAVIAGSALLSIVTRIVAILVSGIAIVMAADAWEGRPVDLNSAFDFMKDKWLLLIIAAIIIAILEILGVLACCIGYVIVVVATVFVRQGIVLDNYNITDSFRNSFQLAKQVWPDILVIYIIYIIAAVILGIIPVIGGFLAELVNGFFIVAFTLYYISLTRNPPVEPQPEL
ncbi:hypothetical protein EF808_01705 [archaeon]|nr:MAG: hypothetical protein EF808_01705 [archaeon]